MQDSTQETIPGAGRSLDARRWWSLVLCWKSTPRAVDTSDETDLLVRGFDTWCRGQGAICLTDALPLAPARGVRGLLKPVPRVQTLVTAVLPGVGPLESLRTRTKKADETADGLSHAELERFDHVLFWTPAEGIPTLEQVEGRLARFRAMGAGGVLGSLSGIPPKPGVPPVDLAHPAGVEMRRHEERLRARPEYASLQYDRRCFHATGNSPNGDVQPGLRFDYYEHGGIVWAWYEGSGVHLGSLVARKTESGALQMAYQHQNDSGELRAGECVSFPEFLSDGRLRMHEYWRWTSGDQSTGVSQIEESSVLTVARKFS